MKTDVNTWCVRDAHIEYERFTDFNKWLSSDEAEDIHVTVGVENVAEPSKALFAGDRVNYDQFLQQYRADRWHDALNQDYFDDHWYDRNEQRFEQLVLTISKGAVVPFVGAGLSKAGGLPTWKEHLRQQGRTAGLDTRHVDALLASGDYEQVIQEIEKERGSNVFAQEIRDAFSRTGRLTDTALLLSELFRDTVITTNYDRLLEQAFDSHDIDCFLNNGRDNAGPRPPGSVEIIKLHGDIANPLRCIIGKRQYDDAYGPGDLDLNLAIPQIIKYHYLKSSLLFVGCSLHNDRTVRVFKTINASLGDIDRPQHFAIDQAPEDEDVLVHRNAFLAELGITGIWFEQGAFDYIDKILSLARDELRHRGFTPGVSPKAESQTQEEPKPRYGLLNRVAGILGLRATRT
jgi:NAD-dependent SIR2 family protein deacetylase